MSLMKRFAENLLKEFLSDQNILLNLITSIVIEIIEKIDIAQLIDILDKKAKVEEVLPTIPPSIKNMIRSKLSNIDKTMLRNYAYKYINEKNILEFLRRNRADIYAIIINHPYGIAFVRDLKLYIFKHLDELLA